MARFKDAADREWEIFIDAPTIHRARTDLQLDLADREETYRRLDEDVVLLVNTVYYLCEDQAKEAGVSDTQFGRGLVGDAIDRATDALLQAIDDFTPARKRSLPRALAEKNRQLREKAQELARAKLDRPETERAIIEAMRERMDSEIDRAVTQLRSPSSVPASSGSAPAD